MKLPVLTAALVIPWIIGSYLIIAFPSAWSFSFSNSTTLFSTTSSSKNKDAPESTILTFLNICLTIISMCLSFTVTPWSLYTCCTDSRINCSAATSPLIFRTSNGEIAPSVILSPAFTSIPSVTTRRSPTGTKYSL